MEELTAQPEYSRNPGRTWWLSGWLIIFSQLSYTVRDHLPRHGAATVDSGLNEESKQSPTDMPTGRSQPGNFPIVVLFPENSRSCQVNSLSQPGHGLWWIVPQDVRQNKPFAPYMASVRAFYHRNRSKNWPTNRPVLLTVWIAEPWDFSRRLVSSLAVCQHGCCVLCPKR